MRYAVVASRGVWRSLVARFVRDEEVVGSNPATPTREIRCSSACSSRSGNLLLRIRYVFLAPCAVDDGCYWCFQGRGPRLS